MGSCPAYKINIFGDGHATYKGISSVDVKETHSYRVSSHDLAELIEEFRRRDVWSAPEYWGMGLDGGDCLLTIDMGGSVHHPGCASSGTFAIGRKIEKVARSEMWINLSRETLAQLRSENFDFHSQEAGAILSYAMANSSTADNAAIFEMIKLGAPLGETYHSANVFDQVGDSLLYSALWNHRSEVVDPLVKAGLLNTVGHPDQQKIESAFRAAIAGGDFELVKNIWEIPGSSPHPSLTFPGYANSKARPKSPQPVILLLMPPFDRHDQWDGPEIAAWLMCMGCDIRATNDRDQTLLTNAVDRSNVNFLRFLLAAGINKPTPDAERDKEIWWLVRDEEIALMLLNASAGLPQSDQDKQAFHDKARNGKWLRVLAWLEEHGK
jgi:hypothetical protein